MKILCDKRRHSVLTGEKWSLWIQLRNMPRKGQNIQDPKTSATA